MHEYAKVKTTVYIRSLTWVSREKGPTSTTHLSLVYLSTNIISNDENSKALNCFVLKSLLNSTSQLYCFRANTGYSKQNS